MGAIIATLVAGLGAAVISAVVSLLVARYVVKKGPNYETQLNELRGEIARLSTTHEGLLAHQMAVADDERQRRADAAWRPGNVRLESDAVTRSNVLTIVANQHFSVERVDILAANGAVVATIPGNIGSGVMVSAINFPIPAEPILALVTSDPDYQRFGKTTGRLRYALSVGIVGKSMAFELPFSAIQEINSSTVWTRLKG